MFRNCAVWDPRHNSVQHMVLGWLDSAPLREYTKYLGQSTCPPLRPPITLTREDGLFMALQRSIPKPKAQKARNNACISEDTLILVDKRVTARRYWAQKQTLLRRLGHSINASMKG